MGQLIKMAKQGDFLVIPLMGTQGTSVPMMTGIFIPEMQQEQTLSTH